VNGSRLEANARASTGPGGAAAGRWLAVALLTYLLATTLFITLVPFRFAWPGFPRVHWIGGPLDIVANVALFVPLGFLFRWARQDAGSVWQAVVAAVLLSAAIEAAQLFERVRFASPLDVLANALGALAGAAGHDRLKGRLRDPSAVVARFALDLPLMGLVYLMIPLLWLNAFATWDASPRFATTTLLAATGAVVLGAVDRHHFRPAAALAAGTVPLAAAAWFLIGTVPGHAHHPSILGVTAAAVAGAVALLGRAAVPSGGERRYEVDTLRRVTPLFTAYLLGIALWPLVPELAPATPRPPRLRAMIATLGTLEYVAAFTLLGYLLAEWRGRLERRMRADLPRVATWSAVAAAGLEAARHAHPLHDASAIRGGAAATAAVFGAVVYHLQRAHIRNLVEARGGGTLRDLPGTRERHDIPSIRDSDNEQEDP